MTEPRPVPSLELVREETVREDGRYLIYYTFTEPGTAGDVAPAAQPEEGESSRV